MIQPGHIGIFTTLTALLLSCTDDFRDGPSMHNDMEQMHFTAYADTDCESRTWLDGHVVRWHDDDIIGIHDGLTSTADTDFNQQFEVTSINPDGSAVFSGKAATGQSIYYATYPYDAKNHVTPEGRMRIGFLSSQTASSPGTFDRKFNSAAAVLKDGTFRFKNLGGLLKFT